MSIGAGVVSICEYIFTHCGWSATTTFAHPHMELFSCHLVLCNFQPNRAQTGTQGKSHAFREFIGYIGCNLFAFYQCSIG